MAKTLCVIRPDGCVCHHSIVKLLILLMLTALSIVAALAINETIRFILGQYITRDNVLGYLFYCFVAIGLIVLLAYIGTICYPDLIEHIDLS